MIECAGDEAPTTSNRPPTVRTRRAALAPMKFLCLDCDQPMKLHSTEGPDEGSLSVTFRCPECGFRVAMLTNPFETQMVRSLGVKVGGRTLPAEPFENLRATMAGARTDAFEGTGESGGSCRFAAAMRGALRRGEPVTLVGFGTFSVARRRPRTLRNPRTGHAVTVTGRTPRFKPSAELKATVR